MSTVWSEMTHAQKMRTVVENAIRNSDATALLDRFRDIREIEGPQRLPSAMPSHETPKRR